ncbi:MAG: amidohydrolase family protein, partial [Planctomycetales bacterium]|nr:amidohydrolase family protein [Planctomycetales bacterium]
MRTMIVLLMVMLASTTGAVSSGDEKGYSFDVLIRGGRIIDGTGNPWFVGDVGIKGDRIVAVGRQLMGESIRTIDGTGRFVSPGFIDIHSHSDLLLFEDGDAPSKIRQGVTTEVLGEGESSGPYVGQLSPHGAVIAGQRVTWTTLGEYFDLLEKSQVAVNVASYVGLNNVWQSVMGSRFDRPNADELDQMRNLVDQAMQQGALGLSSQVMMPPGSLATTEEITELCRVVATHNGIYSTHIRNEGTGVFAAVQEAIDIAEHAGVPVDIIHLKIADQQLWGKMPDVVEVIESARRRGVNVQANVYPYTRGNNNLVS